MLAGKLQFKPGTRVHLINAPFSHDQLFEEKEGILRAGAQGWEPLTKTGYGPVRQVAIDHTWSALRWIKETDIKRKPDSTFRR